MSEMETSQGYSGALGIKKETTFNVAATPPSLFIEIESETFDENRNWLNAPGIDGTRSRAKTRSAATTLDPRGGFNINGVKGAHLPTLLELALGCYGSGSGSDADLLPTFTTVVKKGPKYGVWAGCKMSKLELSSSQDDQALKAAIEAVAASLTVGSSSDLGTPSYSSEIPLTHCRSTFTIGGTAVRAKSHTLTLVNKLDEEVFRNSQTRLAIPETGEREVTGQVELDWSTANYAATMELWRAGTYAEFRAVYTNGVNVFTIVCPNCRTPSEWGKLSNKETILAPVKYEAFASAPGQRDEIQVYVAAA